MTLTMDHEARVLSRVYAQYRDKPNLVAWLLINAAIANTFEAVLEKIAASYDIDNADTNQLDVIGRIVGIGRYYAAGATLTNDIYRLVLKSKVWKNNSDATIDSIIQGVSFITGITKVALVDNEDMTFTIQFFQPLTQTQRDAVTYFDIVPRPMGVMLRGFEEVAGTDRFGKPASYFGRARFARFFGG